MKFYELSTTGIDLNMADTIIVVNNFRFLPKYSRKEYNRRLKYENDLFSIKTKSVTFNGLDLDELLSFKSGIELNSIVVQSPDIVIYRDKNLPDPPYKYHPLLAGLIKKIPVPFIADSVLIKDGNLVYAEKQKHTETPGKVSFTKMNITIGNVTNNPDRLDKNHFMPIDIEAKLYQEAEQAAGRPVEVEQTTDGKYVVLWMRFQQNPPPKGTSVSAALTNFIDYRLKNQSDRDKLPEDDTQTEDTNEDRDNDANNGKTDRLIDKPSGETRLNVDDIRDNDGNDDGIDRISSELSGEARQGKDDKEVSKLSGDSR